MSDLINRFEISTACSQVRTALRELLADADAPVLLSLVGPMITDALANRPLTATPSGYDWHESTRRVAVRLHDLADLLGDDWPDLVDLPAVPPSYEEWELRAMVAEERLADLAATGTDDGDSS